VRWPSWARDATGSVQGCVVVVVEGVEGVVGVRAVVVVVEVGVGAR
jgi:hypothetical protein